jgi:hypothetical protein
MPEFKKHVGRNKNGTRLAVVFREIPGAEDYCLCVETDSLSDMYHDQLLREIDSRDAQATVDLFEVLTRRHFGDGQQMLNALHNKGLLRKYPVSEIIMVPMPNREVKLQIVNEQIAGTLKESDHAEEASVTNINEVVEKASADTGVSVDTEAGLQKVEVKKVEVGTVGGDDSKATAESKLLQARLMEEDAKKLRNEAYTLDPDLKKGGRPKKAKAE